MWTRRLGTSRVVSLQTILLLSLSAMLLSCVSRTVGVTWSAPATARAASSRPLGLDLYTT